MVGITVSGFNIAGLDGLVGQSQPVGRQLITMVINDQ